MLPWSITSHKGIAFAMINMTTRNANSESRLEALPAIVPGHHLEADGYRALAYCILNRQKPLTSFALLYSHAQHGVDEQRVVHVVIPS